jgi:hypothetical protein
MPGTLPRWSGWKSLRPVHRKVEPRTHLLLIMRQVTIRLLDSQGHLCRGADVTLLVGDEVLGSVPASTGRVRISLPNDETLQVEAKFEDADMRATVAPGETKVTIRFQEIVVPPLGVAERAASWLVRQSVIRAALVSVGSLVLAPLSPLVLGAERSRSLDLDKLLPEGPLAHCSDGSSGRPCVNCRGRKTSVRICA